LEIGTGTGYNSALLAALTGPEGTVVSVELEPDLAARAAAVLANVCGMRIQVVTGDGRDGYSAGSPYDRVIVTSGARAIAGPWKEQLIDDGRLVVPIVDESGAGSIGTFDKVNGELVCRAQIPCGFLLMRRFTTGHHGWMGAVQLREVLDIANRADEIAEALAAELQSISDDVDV